MDSNLEPLGAHKAGVVAIAVAATCSITVVSLFAIFATITITQYIRQTPLQRLNDTASRGSRFLYSTGGFLLCNMLAGDFIQAIAFSFNYAWAAQGGIPIDPTPLCTAQGVMIQIGDLGSTFGSLILGVHLFLILVYSYKPTFRWILAMVVISWSIIIVMTVIGPRYLERDGIPFYGSSGGWCWISAPYADEKLYLQYIFVFIVSGINILLYTVIYATIYKRRLKHVTTSGPDSSAVARILLIYPLIYVATLTPLAITRVAAISGLHWPIRVELGAGVVFTLSGTANVIYFTTTRQLISKQAVVTILKTIKNARNGTFSRSDDSLVAKHRTFGVQRESSEPNMVGLSSTVSEDPLNPRRESSTPSSISMALETDVELEKGGNMKELESDSSF